VEYVIDYKWDCYGRRSSLWSTIISTLLALHYSFYTVYSTQQSVSAQCIWSVILGLNALPLMMVELLQIMTSRHSLWPYLSNPWNAVDIISYTGLLTTLPLRLYLPHHEATYIIAAGGLILWLKLLYFFRGFRATGPLVRIISRVATDTRFFLLLLLVFITGFSNCLYMITQVDLYDYYHHDEGIVKEEGRLSAMHDNFGSCWYTVLSVFSAMTGNYDLSLFQGSSLYVLATLLYLSYIIAQAIVMLNILIAIMGGSFADVQAMARGEWRREQAKIVMELEGVIDYMMPRLLHQCNPRWLHVVMKEGKDGGLMVVVDEEGVGERMREIGEEVVRNAEESLLAKLLKVVGGQEEKEEGRRRRKEEEELLRETMRLRQEVVAMKSHMEMEEERIKKVVGELEVLKGLVVQDHDYSKEQFKKMQSLLREALLLHHNSGSGSSSSTRMGNNHD